MVVRRHDVPSSVRRRTDGGGTDAETISLTEGENPSTTVIRAVSAVSDCPATEMKPFYSAIDPEALDGLFWRGKDGRPRLPGQFRFTYNGCEVTLEDDRIHVRELRID